MGKTTLALVRHPQLEKHYIEVIKEAVNEMCVLEKVSLNDFDLVLFHRSSPDILMILLISELNICIEKVVNISRGSKNWLTASFPQSLNYSIKNKLLKTGDKILIIEVGSGVQAGCAIYYF